MGSFFNLISFNRHYLSASLVYLGLTFFMLSALPELILYAQGGTGSETTCSHTVEQNIEGQMVTTTLPGCAEGYTCCESTGECVEIE